MKTEIDRELLIRYINNSCTAEDLSRVKQFLKNPRWQQELENLLEKDYLSMDHQLPDEAALEEWNQEFRDKYFKKSPGRFRIGQWFGYAAACIVLLGIAGYLLNKPGLNPEHATSTAVAMVEKTNPRGTRSKVTLPDSSVVYLGAGSSIRFPEQFAAKQRTLMLTGEAFFEISKNPKRPFVIHTGEIQTTVLGTSFKITAFKGDPLSVEVATGKVRVSRKGNKKELAELAVLTPGEGVTWNAGTEKAVVRPASISAVKGWAAGEISFKNRSLAQIAAELENWYDAEISFKNSVPVGRRFSLSVDGTASLADVLDIICNTAHLKSHFKGNREFVISGNK